MASMVSATSPTSLQIRFGHRCRGSFIRVQFRAANRRIRPIYAAGAPASGGGKRSSWNGPDASPDTFAGWSNSESDSDSGDPKKKGGYGGIWGAGLAGVFFAAGVTFASISLRNKTTSVKQQMEPLTTDQEVLLTSDDQGNESTYLLPNEESNFECNSNCGTGINKESLPPAETNGNSIEEGLDTVEILETPLVENSKSTDNSVEAIHNASDQVDSQIWKNSDIILVPSDCNPSAPELSAHEVLDLASSFKDTSSSIHDSDIRYDVNPGTDNHVELSLDLTNHPTDYQEGNINKKKAVDSELSVDFSSEFEGQIPIEPLSTILESSNTVGLGNRDAGKTATSVLKEEDIECGGKDGTIYESNFDEKETAQLPNKTIDSSDEHKLDENTRIQSVFLSVSELEELSGKEPDIRSYSEIDRSLPFESVLSERTFSYAGIPAPSFVSAAILQVPPGKVLVPAVVDQVQGQALAALQVLKVIEADVIPGDLCTRREYARWLVSASSALSRNTVSKVYPAMYIENVTELAFDDVTPEDRDFPYIQGLAESGIISSKLSIADVNGSFNGQHESFFFYPESPLSRQDLVSWKMALEKRQLPEVDRNDLYKCSGYIDTDKINPDAWPALVADLSSGEQGITALAFGYTRLFLPNKPVTKAQAAIALATGDAAEVVGEELTRIEAESLAENVVNAHTALIAQVEKDLNASFEQELAKEREKIDSIEKLAEETRVELERLRAEREEDNIALIKGRAAVESEMEVLSRLRRDVEEQLQDLLSNKVKISFERDRINKLRKETETENQVIVQLQYELEVERKALSMARAWAEEEAKRAREQARTLEEARGRWEMHGLKVVVDEDLQDAASAGTTWMTAGDQQLPVAETISRAERLVTKLRSMAAEVKLKSSNLVKKIIERLIALITALKQWLSEAPNRAMVLGVTIRSKACRSVEELKETAAGMKASAGEKARRVAEDCKESVDKITQKFKT